MLEGHRIVVRKPIDDSRVVSRVYLRERSDPSVKGTGEASHPQPLREIENRSHEVFPRSGIIEILVININESRIEINEFKIRVKKFPKGT